MCQNGVNLVQKGVEVPKVVKRGHPGMAIFGPLIPDLPFRRPRRDADPGFPQANGSSDVTNLLKVLKKGSKRDPYLGPCLGPYFGPLGTPPDGP